MSLCLCNMTEQNAVLRSRYNNVYVYLVLVFGFVATFNKSCKATKQLPLRAHCPWQPQQQACVYRCFNGRVACLDIKDIPVFLPKVEKKHCVRKSKQAHLGDCMVPDKETLAEPSHIFSSLPPTGLSNPGGWLAKPRHLLSLLILNISFLSAFQFSLYLMLLFPPALLLLGPISSPWLYLEVPP